MKRKVALIIFALAITLPGAALADEAMSPALFTANNIWMMLAAGLVFVMHLGFAMLETGHDTSQKLRQRPVQEHLHHLRGYPDLLYLRLQL